MSEASAQDFEKYNVLILGSPTYGMGELQDDWDEFASHLEGIDFSGKNVAFFGLGDQESYPDTFQDAMGILYEKVSCAGGVTVGAQRVEGYDFSESKAVVGGNFVGLPIDEENQSDLTEERIRTWTEQVRGEIDL
ncbi:MAG: flavodoxin [Candidatus Eisenbacteria sp.]|nr:flavodoxin [Candidatus Eisenbacteria bacterium]